jgi:hypothetical protein
MTPVVTVRGKREEKVKALEGNKVTVLGVDPRSSSTQTIMTRGEDE